MVYKIAYAAGHCLTTAGKRLPKALDPNETREWVLNDRVARHFAEAAKQYEGVELLRLDDPTGKAGNPVADRARKANEWGADLLTEFHHDSAGRVFSGGGMTAFCYKEKTEGAEYRDAIYDACIAAGGLKGNRANPRQAKAYTILKQFKGAGVLLECGFMDSKTDAPVILTEIYSKLIGYAAMEAIAKVAGLKKKKTTEVCTVDLPILNKGDKGEAVKAMQILLIGHGFQLGPKGATGNFGNATEQALHEFKKKRGLKISSKCGAQTWAALLGVS